MPDAAIIRFSKVETSLITTNLDSSKLILEGNEVVLDGATGDSHGSGDDDEGNWSVVAASKLTVSGKMVAITGNKASCNEAHLVAAISKLSIVSTI